MDIYKNQIISITITSSKSVDKKLFYSIKCVFYILYLSENGWEKNFLAFNRTFNSLPDWVYRYFVWKNFDEKFLNCSSLILECYEKVFYKSSENLLEISSNVSSFFMLRFTDDGRNLKGLLCSQILIKNVTLVSFIFWTVYQRHWRIIVLHLKNYSTPTGIRH